MLSSIELSLLHSPAPGVQWEYEVRIEATATGHRVVVRNPYSGRMRTVRRSRKALTWRAALNDLLKVKETWLHGDLRTSLDVTGVHGWQADMLRLAACRVEDSPPLEAELLVQLSDEVIERVAERWGKLTAEPALAVLNELVEVHAESGALSVIEDLVMRSSPDDGRAPGAWLTRVRQACRDNPGLGPSLATARSLQDAAALLTLAEGPPPRNAAVRALLFQRWVELVLTSPFHVRGLGNQPELIAAEWIVDSCAKPGEIARAAESDPALKSAVERFKREADAFVQRVAAIPEARSYAAGIGRMLERGAAAKFAAIRHRVLGD